MTPTVKMKADMLGMSEGTSDRWYLTNGTTAVGPVNLDLIARGIESGRVPLESFVRHEAWKVWRPLSEFALVVEPEDGPPSDDTPLPRFLLPIPAGGDLDGLSDLDFPAEPASDDITAPARPSTPSERCPSDALAGAAGFEAALQLALAEAVRLSRSEVGLIHRLDGDAAHAVAGVGPVGDGAGATCTPVPCDLRIPVLDAAVVAACAHQRVISEPTPGPAGHATLRRLGRRGVQPEHALMFPIGGARAQTPSSDRLATGSAPRRGRPAAMLELGKRTAFAASEVADVESLVAALADEIRLRGWAPERA